MVYARPDVGHPLGGVPDDLQRTDRVPARGLPDLLPQVPQLGGTLARPGAHEPAAVGHPGEDGVQLPVQPGRLLVQAAAGPHHSPLALTGGAQDGRQPSLGSLQVLKHVLGLLLRSRARGPVDRRPGGRERLAQVRGIEVGRDARALGVGDVGAQGGHPPVHQGAGLHRLLPGLRDAVDQLAGPDQGPAGLGQAAPRLHLVAGAGGLLPLVRVLPGLVQEAAGLGQVLLGGGGDGRREVAGPLKLREPGLDLPAQLEDVLADLVQAGGRAPVGLAHVRRGPLVGQDLLGDGDRVLHAADPLLAVGDPAVSALEVAVGLEPLADRLRGAPQLRGALPGPLVGPGVPAQSPELELHGPVGLGQDGGGIGLAGGELGQEAASGQVPGDQEEQHDDEGHGSHPQEDRAGGVACGAGLTHGVGGGGGQEGQGRQDTGGERRAGGHGVRVSGRRGEAFAVHSTILSARAVVGNPFSCASPHDPGWDPRGPGTRHHPPRRLTRARPAVVGSGHRGRARHRLAPQHGGATPPGPACWCLQLARPAHLPLQLAP